MTSPVASLIGVLHPKMCGGEFGVFFDDAKRARQLRAVFDAYYADASDKDVVFDTNRSWSARAALLGELFPHSRIICCVRDVGRIIDSIERMLDNNPLQLSRMFNFQPGASVYGRAEALMHSETGLIGAAWSALRDAWFGPHAQRLVVVQYDTLAKRPQHTLDCLYAALGEAPFRHDLDHVDYDEPDYDAHLGMPGLHKVRAQVAFQQRNPGIPPDLFAKYASASFWAKPELNTRGVTII